MGLLSGTYDLGIRAIRGLSPIIPASPKIREGVRGRKGALAALHDWAVSNRDPRRPLIWVHAPSVGEGFQAKAVLQALKALEPDVQAVHTFFSPSAVGVGRSMPTDVSAYLPWDVRSELAALLGVLAPSVLAFTRTEVWPGLAGAATGMGVPVVLMAGTLSADSGRLGPVARPLLRPTFASLSRVLAVAEEDARRFLELGVPRDRVVVSGDPAVDSAWERVRAADPRSSVLAPFRDHSAPILVAGSTWESDEDVLAPALATVQREGHVVTAVIAPHEPTDAHLTRLEARLDESGLPHERLAAVERRGTVGSGTVVVVDRVGVLAHLYTAGAVAYVGGGFHGAGLHSVIEPAAAGLPVVFGPKHDAQRAAAQLVAAGAARIVGDSAQLATALREWTDPGGGGEAAGEKALKYVQTHLGAAARTAETLAAYFPRREVGPRES